LFLDLDPHWRRSLFFPIVKAARKGGLQGPGWKPLRLFDAFLEQHPRGLDRNHASARYLELWHKLTGHPDRGFGYNLSHALEPPRALPALPSSFVCLAPGAGNAIIPGDIKRWPVENWRRLADEISLSGLRPVWLGSQDDARLFATGDTGLSLMGKLDLRETCQLIARSAGLIGNDSGLYHIAVAMNVGAVGLFGPTNPQRTGPFRTLNSLVLKAGIGRVEPHQLTDHSPSATRDALDAIVPMEQLGFDLVKDETLRFFARARRC
jgi:ADP-heptose:LPS heptosyltransferase